MSLLNQLDLPTADKLPARGTPGYAPGAMIFKRTFPIGVYVNHGTNAMCQFVPMTQDPSEFVITDAGNFLLTDNDTAVSPTRASHGIRCNALAESMATVAVNAAAHQIYQWAVSAADTITSKYPDSGATTSYNWLLAQKGGIPAYDIVFAGIHTCVGTDGTEDVTLAGALSTDIAFAQEHTAGGTARALHGAAAATDKITITLAGSPTTGTAIKYNYMVLRARGVSQPTHYIHKTALYTALDADTAAMSVVDADVKTTDVLFAMIATTDDTDNVVNVKCSVNGTLIITASADPVTDHTFQYFVIRAL